MKNQRLAAEWRKFPMAVGGGGGSGGGSLLVGGESPLFRAAHTTKYSLFPIKKRELGGWRENSSTTDGRYKLRLSVWHRETLCAVLVIMKFKHSLPVWQI